MKTVNITLRIDARKHQALEENYEGTIEGFLEYELDTLYEEVVPPEQLLGIEGDIKDEERDRAPYKFALISMKDKDDSFCIMANNCKTFLDVAKEFARDVYHDYPEWSVGNFKSSFGGDYDEINDRAFSMLSEQCGKDSQIGVVAIFNMGDENTVAIKTDRNPNNRVFDLDRLYAATTTTINNDHAFYCDALSDFEGQLAANEAEINIKEQGETEDTGMQL